MASSPTCATRATNRGIVRVGPLERGNSSRLEAPEECVGLLPRPRVMDPTATPGCDAPDSAFCTPSDQRSVGQVAAPVTAARRRLRAPVSAVCAADLNDVRR